MTDLVALIPHDDDESGNKTSKTSSRLVCSVHAIALMFLCNELTQLFPLHYCWCKSKGSTVGGNARLCRELPTMVSFYGKWNSDC